MSSSNSTSSAGDHSQAHGDAPAFTRDPEYVRQRRAIVRAYHPDRGGDPHVFVAKMDELDQQWTAYWEAHHRPRGTGEDHSGGRGGVASGRKSFSTPRPTSSMDNWDRARDIARRHTDADGHLDPGAAAAATVAVATPTFKRWAKRLERATRGVRTRLPRKMPGAVRYAETSVRPRTDHGDARPC